MSKLSHNNSRALHTHGYRVFLFFSGWVFAHTT